MTFAFPSLLWIGLPLLAGVVAIHLLNLRRQKPIKWAAMDFLLESERVNKAWINLRQWLLLAARLLVIALAVFALAKPALKKFTLSALADSRVRHVVVLDDSYSMSDEGAGTAAWGDAVAAVDRVVGFAAERPGHEVSLIRSSAVGDPELVAGDDDQGKTRLRTLLSASRPSQLAAPLTPAIQAAHELCEGAPTGARTIAYLVTDGRRREIEPLSETVAAVESLQQSGAEVRWVSCVASHNPNLTLTDLSPLPGPGAAGVEVRMQVTVANNGSAPTTDALVQITRDGSASPAVEIGRIEPGKQATRQFSVLFREPGPHRVTARLEADAISADNARYSVLPLVTERKVLLVDGSPKGRESAPYAAALRPNAKLNTGWAPERVSPRELSPAADFDKYMAVFLLDLETLPDGVAESLWDYVRRGGGLFIAAGENADPNYYNAQLLNSRPQGAANRALPLRLERQVRPPRAEGGDMRGSDHPLFNVFSGDRDSFLGLVSINYLQSVSPFDENLATRVLARHSSGAPLVIEHSAGEGRCVVMLTTVGQKPRRDESWSNLSTLPVFPVLALELAAYLGEPAIAPHGLTVGAAWKDAVREGASAPVRISRLERGSAAPIADAPAGELASLPHPGEAGFYKVELLGADPASDRWFAVNVDPAEGDLRLAAPNELKDALARIGVPVETAVALSASAGDDGPSPLPPLLAMVALGLLLGEQVLGVSASYHQTPSGRAAR
ncbi:hypothetical protein Pla123a_26130 [Posidoniimonas polymericola]|uniref:VWFA domain-containing protein n=1 Tax=Posidoniimonas polymericola TaxID=2528002 RepID=A0A5C5YLL4_9BACT|nr:hypothetical protein Pla123a_26130 [Posidoniimonas polymericola]